MTKLTLEAGKTYRNGADHLVWVDRRISENQFLCVRECHGYCQHEVFNESGIPAQTGPVGERFWITEEVTSGETVSDKNPKPFSSNT